MRTRSSTNMAQIKREPEDEQLKSVTSKVVIVKREPEEEAQQDPEEKCLICYQTITNPTRLDTCNHPIDLDCMRVWLEHAMSCCTCRAAPKDHIIVNEGKPGEYTIQITEIIKAKEKRDRLQAGQNVPLTLERAIIRRAKHEYQLEIERINSFPSLMPRGRLGRRTQTNDQRRRYKEMVEAQNSLNVLLDETDRKTIVSNRHFRKLIYKYNCNWYSASEGIGTSYRPRNVRENDEAESARLCPFIQKELDYVTYARFGLYRTKRDRETMANVIFNRLKDVSIHTPTLHTMLVVEMGLTMSTAEQLQHELFNFAASRLTEEEYFAISCYKLPNVAGQLSDFAVGGLNLPPEVVTLDDEPITVDADEDDVMVVENLSAPRRVLPESNYVREGHRESPDRNEALFARPACLANFQLPPFFQNTTIGYGIEAVSGFTHRPAPLLPPPPTIPPQIAQVFTIDDSGSEPNQPGNSEAPIVLDDGPSSSSRARETFATPERPKRPFEVSPHQQEHLPVVVDHESNTGRSPVSQQGEAGDDCRYSHRRLDRYKKGVEKMIRRMPTADLQSTRTWLEGRMREIDEREHGLQRPKRRSGSRLQDHEEERDRYKHSRHGSSSRRY